MSKNLTISIETSGRVGSVAIGQGTELIKEHAFSGLMKHSAELFPTLESLLLEIGANAEDIKQVDITSGPGSFTGLRIAVTVAKMLHFTQKAQIVAADSMDVIAESARQYMSDTGHHFDCIATILDAKKDLFFFALFDVENDLFHRCLNTQLTTAKGLLDWLRDNNKKNVGLLGEGLVYYSEQFDAPETHLLDKSYWHATAAGLFRVGLRMASDNQFADPFTLTPKYIREPDAVKKRR